MRAHRRRPARLSTILVAVRTTTSRPYRARLGAVLAAAALALALTACGGEGPADGEGAPDGDAARWDQARWDEATWN